MNRIAVRVIALVALLFGIIYVALPLAILFALNSLVVTPHKKENAPA